MVATLISVIALIISILGIVITGGIAIYVYKKTNVLTVVLHEDNKRDERINTVVHGYAQLLRSNKSSDIAALIQAGMATLQDEGEAREAIKRISALQAQRNPLSERQSVIEAVGILRVFQNITYQQYVTGRLDEIIRSLGSIPK